MNKKLWEQFEDYICQKIKEVDINARRTPGSGNKGRKGDIFTNCGLHIECKFRNKKNVYNEDDLQKTIQEVPLHSKKIPILFTRNKDGKVRAHLEAGTFLDLYIELINYRKGKI